jgi:hypothetical protein
MAPAHDKQLQRTVIRQHVARGIGLGVWGAIAQFHEIATA